MISFVRQRLGLELGGSSARSAKAPRIGRGCGAINTVAALIARIGHAAFDVAGLAPFILGAAGGALAGRRVADRVAIVKRTLSSSFAGLLFVIAIYVAVRALSALRG
ncbi:MAG: hypothetical protein ACYDCS_14130 [Candidatus Dormibacteria bacterium]